MKTLSSEAKIGAASLAGLALLGLMIFSITGWRLQGSGPLVDVLFSRVDGLREGAPVRVAGVQVGKVEEIQLAADGVLVRLRLQPGQSLPEDGRFFIGSSGILGEKHVEVSPRGVVPAVTGDLPRGEAPLDMEVLLAEVHATLQAMQEIIQLFTTFVSGEDLLAEMVNLVEGLGSTSDELGRTMEEVRSFTQEATGMTKTLAEIAAQMKELPIGQTMDDLQKSASLLEATLRDAHLMVQGITAGGETAADLRAALDSFRQVAGQLERISVRMDDFTAELTEGGAAEEIREIVASSRRTVKDLEQAVGRFVSEMEGARLSRIGSIIDGAEAAAKNMENIAEGLASLPLADAQEQLMEFTAGLKALTGPENVLAWQGALQDLHELSRTLKGTAQAADGFVKDLLAQGQTAALLKDSIAQFQGAALGLGKAAEDAQALIEGLEDGGRTREQIHGAIAGVSRAVGDLELSAQVIRKELEGGRDVFASLGESALALERILASLEDLSVHWQEFGGQPLGQLVGSTLELVDNLHKAVQTLDPKALGEVSKAAALLGESAREVGALAREVRAEGQLAASLHESIAALEKMAVQMEGAAKDAGDLVRDLGQDGFLADQTIQAVQSVQRAALSLEEAAKKIGAEIPPGAGGTLDQVQRDIEELRAWRLTPNWAVALGSGEENLVVDFNLKLHHPLKDDFFVLGLGELGIQRGLNLQVGSKDAFRWGLFAGSLGMGLDAPLGDLRLGFEIIDPKDPKLWLRSTWGLTPRWRLLLRSGNLLAGEGWQGSLGLEGQF